MEASPYPVKPFHEILVSTIGVLLRDEPDIVNVCLSTPVKSSHSRSSFFPSALPAPEDSPGIPDRRIPSAIYPTAAKRFPADAGTNAEGERIAAAETIPARFRKSRRVVFPMMHKFLQI